jgi:hypothetical protein
MCIAWGIVLGFLYFGSMFGENFSHAGVIVVAIVALCFGLALNWLTSE